MKSIVGRLNPLARFLGSWAAPTNPLRKWASKAWESVLRSTGTDVQIRLNEEPTWVLPRWRSLDRNYESETVASFVDSLKPGQTVWDVGANVGIFSIIAARQVGKDGKVVAWEPSPDAFVHLQYHLKVNGLSADCIQEAVHDGKTQEIRFQVDSGNGTSFHNRVSYAEADKSRCHEINVRCRSLDEWAETLKPLPDVIKMDIEGAEVFALKGALRLLKGDFGKRPRVLLSVHPASIHQYGETCGALEALVKELKYVVARIHPNSGTLSDFGEVWLNPT
jgi:FkbM family methyltransferase